jgi:hypothetical protein
MGETTAASIVMLAGLGMFHGINPGMGWLFAVALGLQEGSRYAVWRALLPLAAGHALAIAAAIAVMRLIGFVTPPGWLSLAAGGALIVLGLSRLVRHRHPRWVGLRVGAWGLTLWSFLMASAHGAGLMVLPIVLPASPSIGAVDALHAAHAAHAGHAMTMASAAAAHTATAAIVTATLAHGAGYLAITALAAVVVYEKLGVGILRRAWINLDLIWAAALVITGVLTLLLR